MKKSIQQLSRQGRSRLGPRQRPPLQTTQLVRALNTHDVNWVLYGSQVLVLHGADLQPGDLDIIADTSPENLKRFALCLEHLGTVAAFLDAWGGARGTFQACDNWQPFPATADHLDWLFVTPFGMLDIVVSCCDGFDALMQGATQHASGGVAFWACDPRKVLDALEGRTRAKDEARSPIYEKTRIAQRLYDGDRRSQVELSINAVL